MLRAKSIEAARIYARVIYVGTVKVRDGRLHRLLEHETDPKWGTAEVRAPEIHADTLYSEHIVADWIEVDDIYAGEVQLVR